MSLYSNKMLTEIAFSYYFEKKTQRELAKIYGCSRVTISRLLQLARDNGLVEIHIKNFVSDDVKIINEFLLTFNLDTVVLAQSHHDVDMQRKMVATETLVYLQNILRDGMIVAVGEGRNIAAITDNDILLKNIACTFICGLGGTNRIITKKVDADFNCKKLASKFNATSETLYAPAYIKYSSHRKIYLQNPTITRTLEKAKTAEVAIIGIGEMTNDGFLSHIDWFPKEEIIHNRDHFFIVGDMGGSIFFDKKGNIIPSTMNNRTIGLTYDDYKKIPNIIAIASETSKCAAILGALRTGLIKVLCTTNNNIKAILKKHKSEEIENDN